jgi:hypothetical protein
MSSNNIELDDDLPERAGVGVVGYELAQSYDVAKELFLFGVAATLLGATHFPTALPAVPTTFTTPTDFVVTWTTDVVLPGMALAAFFGGLFLTLAAVAIAIQFARAVGVRHYLRHHLRPALPF